MTDHVPTLETCQRLKVAGFPQDLHVMWYDHRQTPDSEWRCTKLTHPDHMEYLKKTQAPDLEWCAAPILTEVLEQLPKKIPLATQWDDKFLQLQWTAYVCEDRSVIGEWIDTWDIGYADRYDGMTDEGVDDVNHDNPAEAAALLWLKLKESDDV